MALAIRHVLPPPIPPDLAGAAECYARAGLYVVPLCWPSATGACGCPQHHANPFDVGKAPLDSGWRTLRLGPGGVRQTWHRYPQANVGLLLHATNLLVLDIDSAAAVAEAEALGLPPAPADECPRPGDEIGRHMFFRRPPGCPTRNAIRAGASTHIDVLADGLVVLPPSRLYRDGRTVQRVWKHLSLLHRPLPPAPAWAVALLREAAAKRTAPSAAPVVPPPPAGRQRTLPAYARDTLTAGPVRYAGDRSDAVFAVACAAIRAGWTDEEIMAECLGHQWIVDMCDKHGDMQRYLTRYVLPAARRAALAPARGA